MVCVGSNDQWERGGGGDCQGFIVPQSLIPISVPLEIREGIFECVHREVGVCLGVSNLVGNLNIWVLGILLSLHV